MYPLDFQFVFLFVCLFVCFVFFSVLRAKVDELTKKVEAIDELTKRVNASTSKKGI